MMENNRYYIYKGYEGRIIGLREYRHWYVPIREFRYIIYDGDHHLEYILKNGIHNYSWNEIDGNNVEEIIEAFQETEKIIGKPTVIIARTSKGKGVSFMEGKCSFHVNG